MWFVSYPLMLNFILCVEKEFIYLQYQNMKANPMQKVSIKYFTDIHTIKRECNHDYSSFFLCTKGYGRADYHGLVVTIEPDAIFLIQHSSELNFHSLSKDIQVMGVMIKKSYLSSIVPNDSFGAHNEPLVYNYPKILLSKAHVEETVEVFNYIHMRIKQTDMHFYVEIITALTISLVLEVYETYYQYVGFNKGKSNRRLDIYQQFIGILNQGQAQTHRRVAYYAERLCITPKYLSEIVKQLTGYTATDVINQYALRSIRVYLENKEISISQIADLMHFESVSYFCRYTKKLLGVTPGYYRSAHLE